MLIISPPFNKVMPSHIFRECDRQYFVVWTEANFIDLGAIAVGVNRRLKAIAPEFHKSLPHC